MERKHKTFRDINSSIPARRVGQEAGTKGNQEFPLLHLIIAVFQLISALQDSSGVPGFTGGAGDTQTVAEHPWLALSNTALSHSQESFKHSLME